jgi:hypothetical protein
VAIFEIPIKRSHLHTYVHICITFLPLRLYGNVYIIHTYEILIYLIAANYESHIGTPQFIKRLATIIFILKDFIFIFPNFSAYNNT